MALGPRSPLDALSEPGRPLRAAIVGCGRIASEVADDPKVRGIYSHAEAYTRCPDTTIVAVCDIDRGRAERCAERWQVEHVHTDLAQLLAEVEPDLVSVCTPDATHEAVLRQVLDAPSVLGVLAEKPLAADLDGARSLAAAAAARGTALAVNYHRRYAASFDDLRELVRAPSFGPIERAIGTYTGGLVHNGSHLIDLLRHLLGDVTSVVGWDTQAEDGPDPSLDARLRFAGGATGMLLALPASLAVFELDVIGAGGRARVTDFGNVIETSVVGDLPSYSGYRGFVPDGRTWPPLGDVLLHAVEDLVGVVRNGGVPRCSAADGVAALAVADAVTRSAATGTSVDVEPATSP